MNLIRVDPCGYWFGLDSESLHIPLFSNANEEETMWMEKHGIFPSWKVGSKNRLMWWWHQSAQLHTCCFVTVSVILCARAESAVSLMAQSARSNMFLISSESAFLLNLETGSTCAKWWRWGRWSCVAYWKVLVIDWLCEACLQALIY